MLSVRAGQRWLIPSWQRGKPHLCLSAVRERHGFSRRAGRPEDSLFVRASG